MYFVRSNKACTEDQNMRFWYLSHKWAMKAQPSLRRRLTRNFATHIYTTFTNFSTKYRVMCTVYTDVGGIK